MLLPTKSLGTRLVLNQISLHTHTYHRPDSIMCETSPNGVVPNSVITVPVDNWMGSRAGFAYVIDPTFISISPSISFIR